MKTTSALCTFLLATLLSGCGDASAPTPSASPPTASTASSATADETAAHESIASTPPTAKPSPTALGDAGEFPLAFATREHDFGLIADTESVSASFSFENVTAAPITVKSLEAACGCTVPALKKTTFAPGETGVIDVEFRPQGRQGKERKPITLTLEGDPPQEMQVHVSVDVFPMIGWEPRALHLGLLERGEASQTKTVVMTSRIPDLELKSFAVADENFQVELRGSEPGEVHGEKVMRHEFAISFAGGTEIALNRTHLEVETSDAARGKLRIPVLAEVIGPILVSPNRVQLNGLDVEEPFTRTLTIRLRAGKGDFRVADVTAEVDRTLGLEFDPEVETQNGMKVVKLNVRGVAPSLDPKGGNTIKGMLTFTTGLEEQPFVEVPIGGFVRLP